MSPLPPIRRVLPAVLVLGVLTLGACKRKNKAPVDTAPPADTAGIAEPGGGGADVSFRITAIHENEQPSGGPPFHAPGGTWTFFDATAAGVPFGFGFEKPGPKAGSFTFGKGILTVPDAAAGKRLAALFAKAFHGKVPPEKTATPLHPKSIGIAFLGIDTKRGAGFSGSGGGWYATKLFLQRPGIEAEVFCNFNLRERTGEFAEKDSDYADGIVAFIADELRDGPRPKRTPETDPRLATSGPKLTWVRAIPGKPVGMNPERDHFLYTLPLEGGLSRVMSTPIDRDDPKEIATVAHRLRSVDCAGEVCLVREDRPTQEGAWSSDDPATLMLVDQKTKATKDVKGEWGKHPKLHARPWSEDGSFFIVGAMRPTGVGQTKYEVLYFVDRAGNVRGPVDLGKDPIQLVSSARSRVVVRSGLSRKEGAKTSWLAIDPATLKVSPTTEPAPPIAAEDDDEGSKISPDKKRSVSCAKDGSTITIKLLPDGPERVFDVHADDRQTIGAECVSWAGPMRLAYLANVRGWLDVDTLKISGTIDEDLGALEYDKTFHWVVESGKTITRVGRIDEP